MAIRYVAKRDPKLRTHLMTCNLRLVLAIALEYHDQAQQGFTDLVQEGNFGLLKAIDKYDPNRGIRLTTYASFWIRAYILQFIMDNFRGAKIRKTPGQRKLFYNFRKEQASLEKQGFEATDRDLANAMSVQERDVGEMRQIMCETNWISLSAPGSKSIENSMCSPEDSRPDRRAERRQFCKALRTSLEDFRSSLSEREETIFRTRLYSDEPASLKTIGAQYGLTGERIRQVEVRIVRRLRVHLKGSIGDLSHNAAELARTV